MWQAVIVKTLRVETAWMYLTYRMMTLWSRIQALSLLCPDQLPYSERCTEAESDLLLDRFRVKVTDIEQRSQMNASGQLLRIPRDHERAIMEHLEFLRKPLYDHTNEGQAMKVLLWN